MLHARLSRLASETAAREIVDSRAQLADLIGCPVESFAYPFGDVPPWATQVVQPHFSGGFGIRLAYASPWSSLATCERIDAYYLRGRVRLTDLDRPSTRTWLAARSACREIRRASGYGQR